MDLSGLTIDELDEALVRLVERERDALKIFLEHLMEFHRRRGAEVKAYSGLFAYCTERLNLSEGESFRRVHAARKALEVPLLLDYLDAGKVNLSTLNVLIPHMTPINAPNLLERAAGKSKRDVELIVAGLTTKEPPRDVIRILPAPQASPSAKAEPLLDLAPEQSQAQPRQDAPAPRPASWAQPTPEAVVRIGFTASPSLLGKIERATGLLRHKHPDGRLEHMLDDALEALLDRIDRSRKENPAPAKPVLPGRRRIPEWVKDLVHARDGGRCAFESVDGKRCEASEWLEYDHIRPFALGGASDDPDNVRLLCRAHNQLRAREDFGLGSGNSDRADAQGDLWSGGTFEPGREPEAA